MNIYEILKIETIYTNLVIADKDQLLKKMVEIIASTGLVKDSLKAQKEIFDRERIMSTGVGKGIALPHAKTSAVDDSIASLVTLAEPMDFDALDGYPVNIIFMLLGTDDNVSKHLKLLSKISRIMNNDEFRESILNSNSNIDIFNSIKSYEMME